MFQLQKLVDQMNMHELQNNGVATFNCQNLPPRHKTRFCVDMAKSMFGEENICNQNSANVKYFFHGGDNRPGQIDVNREVWTESINTDRPKYTTLSAQEEGFENYPELYWPLMYAENTKTKTGHGNVGLYYFDQEAFFAAGGKLRIVDARPGQMEKFLVKIKNDTPGGKYTAPTFNMTARCCAKHQYEKGPNELCIAQPVEQEWNKETPYVILRRNWNQESFNQWLHDDKIDCHIFINGAARFLKLKMYVKL